MDRALMTLDASTARKLAVEASVEPRSLLKALRGDAVRGLAGHRARGVLEKYGLLPATENPIVAVARRRPPPPGPSSTAGEEPSSAKSQSIEEASVTGGSDGCR
jgi:hypothetical protein